LCRHHAEGEAGEHELIRQLLGRLCAAPHDLVEPHLAGVTDPVVEVVERLALVEIWSVDRVASVPQLVGERQESLRLSVRMVVITTL
jgi:hypothetical protein